MIYCIYKIEHAGSSCWPGKPGAQGEKVAEIPWMFWLTCAVAVVEPVLGPWATLQRHPLIACCTADAKKMQKVLDPSWNVWEGWTAECTWVKTGTFTEHCLVADAQLPTRSISFSVPGHGSVLGVMKGGILEGVWFLACAALEHIIFVAITLNQCPLLWLITAYFLISKTWNVIMWWPLGWAAGSCYLGQLAARQAALGDELVPHWWAAGIWVWADGQGAFVCPASCPAPLRAGTECCTRVVAPESRQGRITAGLGNTPWGGRRGRAGRRRSTPASPEGIPIKQHYYPH